jgi:hypothetical protein
MINKKLWLLGTQVMILLFGMTVSCEAQNNSGIEGIWDFTKDDEGIWKFEKGKLLVFDDDGELYDECSYTIRSNTLIIDGDDEYKFSIKGNTLTLTQDGETMTGTKITESQSPVGRWIPVRGQSAPSGFPDNLELTNDGTGIGEGMGLKWKIENSRITFDFGVWGARAYYYIIYKSNLVLTNDDGKGVGYKKR